MQQLIGRRALTHHDDLRSVQAHVECVQEREVAEQVVGCARQDGVEHGVSLDAIAIVAGQHRQPHQVLRDQAVVIRNCIVDG